MARRHQGAGSPVHQFGVRCLVLCTLNMLAVVLVLMLITVAIKYYAFVTSNEKRVCLTRECIEISATFLSRMDTRVDPCHNMYRYACGGWLDDVTDQDSPKLSLADESVRSVGAIHLEILANEDIQLKGKNSTAIAKLKLFYQTCMDQRTINSRGASPILKLICQMGSWTVTSYRLDPWSRQSWKLQTAVENLHLIGTFVFFRMSVVKDFQSNTGRVIMLSKGDTSVSSVQNTSDTDVTNLYKAAFASAKFLSGDEKFNEEKIGELIELEIQLAELGSLHDPTKISVFHNSFDWIDLKQYLMTSFHVREIPKSAVVLLDSQTYFEQLEKLIRNTDKEILANYIAWSLIVKHKDFLPEVVSDSFLELEMARGHDVLPSNNRDELCLKQTQNTFGLAFSALFMQNYFTTSSKLQVIKVLVNVKRQFLASLGAFHWLDEAINNELLMEAEAITHASGYKDWIVDSTQLDAFYEGFKVIPGHYLESNIAINKVLRNINNELYWRPINRRRFAATKEASPGVYKYTINNFVFTDIFLQPPIFDSRFSKPIHYGALGFTIAHELVLGLENSHALLYGNHSLDEEIANRATDRLQNKIQCLIDQYNGYKVHDTFVNGTTTLLGNIADNVGLQLAYNAYKTAARTETASLPGLNLTNDQLFFLGFTQLWCESYGPTIELRRMQVPSYTPNKYRALGALSNNVDFSKAFTCKVNETMNPVKKCKIL